MIKKITIIALFLMALVSLALIEPKVETPIVVEETEVPFEHVIGGEKFQIDIDFRSKRP